MNSDDSPIEPFRFDGALFQTRNEVIALLNELDYSWLVDYREIEISSEFRGLEISGIREESTALRIKQSVERLGPRFRYIKVFYDDCGLADLGWKVRLANKKEDIANDSFARKRSIREILLHVLRMLHSKRIRLPRLWRTKP